MTRDFLAYCLAVLCIAVDFWGMGVDRTPFYLVVTVLIAGVTTAYAGRRWLR